MRYTREFPPKAMAGRAHHKDIVKIMDGSPKEGLHAAKIGFGMEMLLAKPPTVIKHIGFTRDERKTRTTARESNLLPLAFKFRDLPPSPRFEDLLRTDDGTVITTFVQTRDDDSGGNNRFNASRTVRDMDADHLWFVYEGAGACYTDLGAFEYGAGDLIYVPKHTLYEFIVTYDTRMIGMQSEKGLRLPSTRPYDNTDIPFNEFAMRLPEPYGREGRTVDAIRRTNHVVFVKRGGVKSAVEYAFTPFLCTAWKGAPYPFAIATSELNYSYVQSIHPDPSNFAVFAAPDASAVLSVLGPRFVHSLPYNHLNAWDEFLFYAREYDARKGSGGGVGESGTATLHPQGIWHGPQMAAFEKWMKEDSHKGGKLIPWVSDLAIMFETRAPLLLCERGQGILIAGYENSWLESWEEYRLKHQRGVGSW